MDSLRTEGTWNRIKGAIKQKWAELTDDDLQYGEGKADDIVGRIQQKTGAAKDEIRAEIQRHHESSDDDLNSFTRRG
ncbi:MAG: CsbD family protein [Sphingobacteriales bacterium]|nr:MAG: CsbD family protein [Sphingobacteriales bacterium]